MTMKLKVLRENLELTQEQVSSLTGVPVKTLRNWEQEIRNPSDWTLDLIMDKLLRIEMEKHIEITEDKGIPSLLTIKQGIQDVAKSYDVDRVYLFGSYAKGTATAESDIDLYMESTLHGLDFFGFAENLREVLKKKIGLLSSNIVEDGSRIQEEISNTGVLIYEK